MRRVIVGISGASGAICGIRALELLRPHADIETHLVISQAAVRTIKEETDWRVPQVEALADHVHGIKDIGAPLASGSFRTAGMLVAPCSVRSLSAIACCLADNLLTRAADVCLKERRPLVLMLREAPLHPGHIRLMAQAAESGAVIMPPMPAFYHRPASIDDMVTQIVARALDQLDIAPSGARRWGEPDDTPPIPS